MPAAAGRDLLDAAEAELYRDLVDGAFCPWVELGRERIGLGAIEQVRALSLPP